MRLSSGSGGVLTAVLFLLIASAPGQRVRSVAVPVFGVVRDGKGTPVEGAEVRAVRFAVTGLPGFSADRLGVGVVLVGSARTDRRGRFVLRVRSAGRFGVVALQGKTARSGVVAPVAPGAQVELQLHAVRRVRGRVVNSRDGVETQAAGHRVRSVGPVVSGVRGRPWPDRYLGVIESVRTDAQGRFELTALAGVSCSIECRGVSVAVEEKDRDAVLHRDVHRIDCTVIDAVTKEPIPGAQAYVAGQVLRADAKARLRAEVLLRHPIDVEADGYRLTRVDPPEGLKFEIALVRAGRVQMRLVDGDGAPLSATPVCVMRIAAGPNGSGPLFSHAETDAAGKLGLSPSKESGCVVWARVGSRFVRIVDVVAGTKDQDLGDVSVATFDVRGTIFDVDGVPAANVPIFAAPKVDAFGSRMPMGQYPVAYTNHAGGFVVTGLARTSYDIAARSRRSLTTFVPTVSPDDKEPLRLRLQLAAAMQGRVVDGKGKPVAGVRLSVIPVGEVNERLRRFGLWSRFASSDTEGRFSIPAVMAEVPHELNATAPPGFKDGETIDVEPPAKGLVLTLTRQ